MRPKHRKLPTVLSQGALTVGTGTVGPYHDWSSTTSIASTTVTVPTKASQQDEKRSEDLLSSLTINPDLILDQRHRLLAVPVASNKSSVTGSG